MPHTLAAALRFFAGALAANVLGWGVCLGYAWLFRSFDAGHGQAAHLLIVTAYPNLVLIPMLMGAVAAWLWRPLQMPILLHLLGTFVILIIGIVGAYGWMAEGGVCLLVASPILFAGVFGGMMVARVLLKRSSKLQVTFVPLLVLLVFAEGALHDPEQRMVSDAINVAASPAEVWKYVIAFPPIAAEPDYWLNKMGLPSPAQTTCEGEFVGAKRACIFSNGLVFREVVSELQSERRLTFEIVEQPNDPELLGHLDLHRGQFELRANSDGTTTLIGRSWYTLHVRPLWYFDWWTRDITREVHLRVMRHIKALAENAG